MHQDATKYRGRPQPRGLCVRWGPSPLTQKGVGVPKKKFSPMCIVAKRLDGSRWHVASRWALAQATLCLMGTQLSPTPNRGEAPNFQPMSIAAKRLHGSRCNLVRMWAADPPPQFSAHVYCGKTARWIKMALGMEVGLGPGHIVLDEDPAALSQKGGRALPHPNCRSTFVAKRLDASRYHLVWR